jgi:hypothetical protein
MGLGFQAVTSTSADAGHKRAAPKAKTMTVVRRAQVRTVKARPRMARKVVRARATPVRVAQVRTKRARVAAVRAGSCGTFKYWKGGRCLDARDKR